MEDPKGGNKRVLGPSYRDFSRPTSSQQTNRGIVPYVPADRCKTKEEIDQFNAGLKNNKAILDRLVLDGRPTEHYFQGLLSWAAFFNKIDLMKSLLSNEPEQHKKLSISYLDDNALFNAVLGGANETKFYLLGLGANPLNAFYSTDSQKPKNNIQKERIRTFLSDYAASQRLENTYPNDCWKPSLG